MKKNLLTLSFAFIFLMNVKAQTNIYHPFPKDTAMWLHNWIPQGCSNNCPFYRTIQLGDTVINTVVYKKMYTQPGIYYPLCGGGTVPCFSPNGSYSYDGAIRQDSVLKKVYFFPATGFTHDTLLYDFNLTVGTVMPTTYLGSGGTVQKIDSLLINNTFHKVFLFNTINPSSAISFLIEGVGNSFGPLMHYTNCINDCWGLGCFNQNSIPNTVASYVNCPLQVLGIDKVMQDVGLTVYPNPANGQFTIETSSTNKQYVDIYDTNGRHLISKIVTDKAVIDAAFLNPGVYTLIIKTAKYVTNKKLVIIN